MLLITSIVCGVYKFIIVNVLSDPIWPHWQLKSARFVIEIMNYDLFTSHQYEIWTQEKCKIIMGNYHDYTVQ
jgi:hypothetical protein